MGFLVFQTIKIATVCQKFCSLQHQSKWKLRITGLLRRRSTSDGWIHRKSLVMRKMFLCRDVITQCGNINISCFSFQPGTLTAPDISSPSKEWSNLQISPQDCYITWTVYTWLPTHVVGSPLRLRALTLETTVAAASQNMCRYRKLLQGSVKTSLHCTDVSKWLGTHLDWSVLLIYRVIMCLWWYLPLRVFTSVEDLQCGATSIPWNL